MKPLLGLLLPAMLKFFVLPACSADSAPSAPGPAAQCNELVHDGSTHTVALASNPPPEPVGGSLAEGSYVLTAARLFNVPLSVDITRQLGASLVVRGDVIERVTHLDGVLSRSTFKYTVEGTRLSLLDTCAMSAAEVHDFSASGGQLEIFSTEPGTGYTLNQVFTKR